MSPIAFRAKNDESARQQLLTTGLTADGRALRNLMEETVEWVMEEVAQPRDDDETR